MVSVAVPAPARAPRSQAKLAFFVIFFATTILVIYLKNGKILDPTSPIAQHFAPVKWYLAVHAFFGATAMAVAAFQFSNRMRARYLKVHRVLGYVYVASVFISAPFAVIVSAKLSKLTLVGANVMNSIGWTITTAIALYCVRSGNIVEHRRWMIRSYPFAMAFTVNRLVQHVPFIARQGYAGRELVVWTSFGFSVLLPTIILEWRNVFPRSAARRVVAIR